MTPVSRTGPQESCSDECVAIALSVQPETFAKLREAPHRKASGRTTAFGRIISETDMEPVFTIGYGNRPVADFLAALSRRRIQYLIDVRSSPRSKYRPEFSANELRTLLKQSDISYVPMGDSLGGRPDDSSCYEDGHVLYDLVRERHYFQDGIKRIQEALSKNLRVCLMCSEGKPEDCHRSKLIGSALEALGVNVLHIDAQDEELSQREVLARITPVQPNFFGSRMTSRKAYKTGRSRRASS